MALFSIELIDGVIGNGAGEVDADEYGADGYVLMDGGMATDTRNADRNVRWLQASQSQS